MKGTLSTKTTWMNGNIPRSEGHVVLLQVARERVRLRVRVRRQTEAVTDMTLQSGRTTLKWPTVQYDKNILRSQEISEVMHFKYSYFPPKKEVIFLSIPQY